MINWQACLLGLRRHHAPIARIAVEVGSNERHLNRLARAEVHEPKFNTGVKLLDLAHDKMPAAEFKRLRMESP